jgi:hypothetical protein
MAKGQRMKQMFFEKDVTTATTGNEKQPFFQIFERRVSQRNKKQFGITALETTPAGHLEEKWLLEVVIRFDI